MTPGFVDARWVASFEADTPDRTHLVPNETVVAIPLGEAEASDNWQIVGKVAKAKAPTAKELKARLDELGVDVPSKAKKPELEDLIAKAEAQAAPEPEPEPEQTEQTEQTEEVSE